MKVIHMKWSQVNDSMKLWSQPVFHQLISARAEALAAIDDDKEVKALFAFTLKNGRIRVGALGRPPFDHANSSLRALMSSGSESTTFPMRARISVFLDIRVTRRGLSNAALPTFMYLFCTREVA